MSVTTVPQLLGAGCGGVFRVAGRLNPARVSALAKLKRLRTFHADCSSARSKRGLLGAIGRALHFPDYFGANWDALADCLTDLEWLGADGIVLVLTGTSVLARRAPRDLAVALDVLQEAAAYWASQDFPFVVLVDAQAGAALAQLPAVRIG